MSGPGKAGDKAAPKRKASTKPSLMLLDGSAATDPLGDLNRHYFVVIHGSRAVVARITYDDLLKRERLDFLRDRDFALFHNNRRVQIGADDDGNPIWAPLGSTWLTWGRRRTYRAVALLPGRETPPDVYNLWRGFGVEPRRGSWATIHDHWLKVICSGNEEHFTYLERWAAHKAQHLCDPAGVCLVMRSGEGAGKGLAMRPLMRLYGSHALQITQAKHLTGHFNAHLLDTVFLFVDEGYWAGDKAAEGVLKGLVTEEAMTIEPKGLNVFTAPSRLAIAMATNNDWVVPAGRDARRFFVLDVSDNHKGDYPYHKKLAAAIDGDETAALLNHLLTMDLSGFDIRDFPRTAALAEQKLLSLDSFGKWWHWCLKHGRIDGDPDRKYWPIGAWRSNKDDLRRDYYRFARDICNDRYPIDPSQFTKRLKMYCGALDIDGPQPRETIKRQRQYSLYSLALHREAFLKSFRIEPGGFDWGHDDD